MPFQGERLSVKMIFILIGYYVSTLLWRIPSPGTKSRLLLSLKLRIWNYWLFQGWKPWKACMKEPKNSIWNPLKNCRHLADIRVIHKVTLSLPSLSPPIPSLSGNHKVMKFLLNLSMKCWKSAFNAEGSRVNIVVAQVGVVKIYVGTVEALRKKDRHDKTQFTTKIDGNTRLGPSYFVF